MKEINLEIREFIEARGWKSHTPSHLLLCLMTELGELSELFQSDVGFDKLKDDAFRKQVSFEMVDVFVYLMRLADECGIDLELAYEEKMPLLGEKYPVGICRENAKEQQQKYRDTGKNRLYD